MSVIVYCGNGGDWEYMHHKYLWEEWIKENVTVSFNLVGHREADKAIVIFKNSHDELLFLLKAPPGLIFSNR